MKKSAGTVPLLVAGNEWVLEKYTPNRFEALGVPLEDVKEIGLEPSEWTLIMNPHRLDVALRWGKKKNEEGLTVRLRNIRTGDIIMGAILGDHGVHRVGVQPQTGIHPLWTRTYSRRRRTPL